MKTFLLKSVLLVVSFFSMLKSYSQVPPTAWTWAKTYNSAMANQDYGYALCVDASGNVYVTGFANWGNGSTDPHLTTIKYNSAGTVQWTSVYDGGTGSSCNLEGGFDIITDGTSVWVSGVSYQGTTNYEELTLIKYSASTGTIQTNYPKTYTDAGCTSSPTTLYSQGSCLTYTVDGTGTHVYVGGSSYDSGNSPNWNFIVLRDDGGTGWTWTSAYTKAGSNTSSTAESRATDIYANGSHVFVTGWIANNTTGKDVWTAQLDASTGSATCGTCWTASYSNSNNSDDVCNVLEVDGNGNVYVAGYATTTTGKDALLLKYNSSGTLQTGFPVIRNGSSSANGDDEWTDMELVGTSTVLVGGYVTTNTTNIDQDYALAAYTTSGSLATGWTTNPVTYDGAFTPSSGHPEATGTDQGHAIEYSSSSGRVYITGMSDEGANPVHAINLTTIGYSSTTGAKVWGASNYDESTDHIPNGFDENRWKYGMEVTYNGTYCADNIYVEGVSVVINEDIDYLTLKWSCPGTGCVICGARESGTIAEEQTSISQFYPNPMTETAKLELNTSIKISDAQLFIYDINGKLVTNADHITSTSITINGHNLNKGIYFYKLLENGEILNSGKFIVTDK